MKIVIIGAGEGGISAARYLADGGHDVTVYEVQDKAQLGYDWHDSVAGETIKEFGITLPELGCDTCFSRKDWQFVFSGCEKTLDIGMTGEINLCRRYLKEQAISLAEAAGAKFVFKKHVSSLIINGTTVTGIKIGEQSISSDIVIDSSGVFSKFRASLPSDMGILAQPASYEVFHTYRAYYEKTHGNTESVDCYPLYLKCNNLKGIAWFLHNNCGNSEHIDILIGQAASLSQQEIDNTLAFFKETYPLLGDKILHGGKRCIIPMRYPAPRFVANGYCIIGDAAFMTMPISGSGIVNAMIAGKILAEVINKNNSATTEGLWEYQVRYMLEVGINCATIDLFKRFLLFDAKDKDVQYVVNSQIISQKDVDTVTQAGKPPGISEVLSKAFSLLNNISLLSQLSHLLIKSKSISNLIEDIPKEYSKKQVNDWQKKYEAIFPKIY